jgi:AraC-like DNA-binding protein
MTQRRNTIPTFDFYKTIEGGLQIVFSKLEESYNTYDVSLPHRHNYYEIIIFNKNGGVHEIDFVTHQILKDTIHFVCPEQVHLLRRNSDVTGYVISFTNDLLIQKNGTSLVDGFPFFNQTYNSPVVLLQNQNNRTNIDFLINKVDEEFNSSNSDKVELLIHYLALLLLEARRNYMSIDGADEKVASRLSKEFKNLVDINYLEIKSVSEYASLLNISSGHLNDTVHKDFGKAASEIIFDRIILEAKRMLYHSSKSIKEIATYLNYDDPSYFSRFFKTHVQSSPEEFRKQIREKYQ